MNCFQQSNFRCITEFSSLIIAVLAYLQWKRHDRSLNFGIDKNKNSVNLILQSKNLIKWRKFPQEFSFFFTENPCEFEKFIKVRNGPMKFVDGVLGIVGHCWKMFWSGMSFKISGKHGKGQVLNDLDFVFFISLEDFEILFYFKSNYWMEFKPETIKRNFNYFFRALLEVQGLYPF